jgi:23S rRNA pseudouridine1911/1915/1917 synthase
MPAKDSPRKPLEAPPEAGGQRLDVFLTQTLSHLSRARVQLLLAQGGIEVDGKPGKPSRKLRGGETISILADPEPPPLHAIPEAIALDVVYEDADLAVVNKPAGMMVHAGSGRSEDARNRGTLVNALLHHMRELSQTGGPLRPGIVHRLDKQTSGLILVAKNDAVHAKLSGMFSRRQVRKGYLALVQGWLREDAGTVNASISRDIVRRTRMTTRREGGRAAISHWKVLRRIEGAYGRFTLVSVRIETGRTHQIRVHMASIGHPVAGDTLYGAAAEIAPLAARAKPSKKTLAPASLTLSRNFLHAAELEFLHPRTGETITLASELPAELKKFLALLADEMPRRGD